MYEIDYAEDVTDDLKRLPARQRQRMLDKIEEQLLHQPLQPTRNKKMLKGLKPLGS